MTTAREIIQAKSSKIVMCANMLRSKFLHCTVAEQDTIVKCITDLAVDIHRMANLPIEE